MSKRLKKAAKRNAAGSPTWMVKGSSGKGNKAGYDAWNARGFFSEASISECKRIDPVTGEATIYSPVEEAATALLKADRSAQKKAFLARTRKPKRGSRTPNVEQKTAFYKSWDWRQARMEIIKTHGRSCQCCGATPGMKTAAGEPVRICVDHIKPLSKFWNLRLDRTNLQVLCDECNQGKGNWDQTDFRPPAAPDEWIIEDEIDPAILAQLSPHGTFQ